jgi:hypothetical protein
MKDEWKLGNANAIIKRLYNLGESYFWCYRIFSWKVDSKMSHQLLQKISKTADCYICNLQMSSVTDDFEMCGKRW